VLVNEEVTVETSEEMRDLGRQLGGLPRAGDLIVLGGPNQETRQWRVISRVRSGYADWESAGRTRG
jgi:hypothetical protein